MFDTKNSLSLAVRKKIIAELTPLLSDAQDLYSQVKQAHWNVRGISFIALHELFDKTASSVNEAVDEIAERIMQLGGTTQGTVRIAAKKSRLKEYPLGAHDGKEHVAALASALGQYTSFNRKASEAIDDAGDPVTADMLNNITAELDKYLWFIEAHK